MYDELKERCRACSQGCIYPAKCSYFDKPPLRCMRQLLSEAADAIEKLSKDNLLYEIQLSKMSLDLTYAKEALPRWIPVTERLPEKTGSYLVYLYGEVTEMNYWHGKWHRLRDDFTKAVTHWMPLPQPPKEE